MSRLRSLAQRYRVPSVPIPEAEPPMDHDAAEPVALAQHYAAPAGPDLPSHDPLAAGLLAGFRRHAAS